jgi:hypothetical protein
VKRVAVAALLLLLAGCAPGNPWPSVPAGLDAPESHTVLLLGDSLLNQTAPDLHGALAWHGLDATVIDESFPGSGLLDPNVVSTQIAKVDAHPKADIVVIEFSGNCFSCPVTYGSAAFFDQWSTSLVAIVDYVQSLDKHAVLVLPPPQRPDLPTAAVQRQLGVQASLVALASDAVLANWWEALVDTSGNYQQVLFYPDLFSEAALHTIRADDGVHLTQQGARRAADWTVAALRQFWTGHPLATTTATTSSRPPD